MKADLTSWSGMLTFAATTGIITAILNQIFGVVRDAIATRAQRRSHAGYLALRLATMLEGYAYECASFIGDNANAPHHPDQEFPSWKIRLPELPSFPGEQDGWHAIDLKLAGRALDLRNHIVGSQGVVNSTAEYAEDDLEEELDQHAAERGQEAWALAKDLRTRHGLPPFDPVWDFTETLNTALNQAKKAIAERAERNAKLLQDLKADME